MAYIYKILQTFPQLRDLRVDIEVLALNKQRENSNSAMVLGDRTTVHDYLSLTKLPATTRIETVIYDIGDNRDVWTFQWQRKPNVPGSALAPMRGEILEWFGDPIGVGATKEELAIVEKTLKVLTEVGNDVSK